MTDELKIRIQALLNRALSKQNIIKDITYLERTPFYLKLIAKLNRSKAKTSIQQDLQSISANQSVTVKARVDRNSVLNSLREAQQAARTEAQNNPIDIPAHFDVDTNGLSSVNQAQSEIIENSGGIKDIVQSYINWNKAIDLIIQTMRKAIDTSNELAKAQTDLQIVTGNNHQQMISLMRDYNQLARELSATTVDVTSAADGWLRTGKSIAETEELIADSTILSKIGKIESAEAQKYLTSAMNGFKVEAKDVISIVDKLSATDLVSATSAGGLAEAMSKCANSADIAGVSMDNLIGYIATVSETTQKSDSVVGESFKTLFARMGKIKLGDFIDDDGNDISGEINDVEKVLGKFDIKLRDTSDEFRNFQDVIYDVGTAWDKFSSVEKNAIANAFGGVYQRENVLTLFENFSRALELAEVSANSSGKALEKYAIYEQGLEAATNRLTAAFESLSYNAIDSDFIARLADGAAGIVEFVDKTKLLQTGLTALTFAGTIKGLLLLGTKLIATKNNVVNMTAAIIRSTKAGALNAEENAMLGNSYSALTAKQQKLILSNKKLSTEQRITILQTQGLTRAEAEQQLQTMGLMTAQQGAARATFSLRGAWEALKLSIASNPLGLIIIALGKVAKSIDELSDKLNSFMSAADTFSNALKKIITNSNLTFDELQKLLSFDPNLIYDVTKNDDGTYNIDKDSLIKSASNYGAENNPYKEDYENSQKEVNKLEQQLASLERKNNDPRIKNTSLTQQIADIKDELEIAKKELAANKLLFEGYNDTIQTSIDTTYLDNINNSFSDIAKEVKDKVGDYNTAITSLQKAIDEISSGKALTYDTITELVKSFPALNDKIREGADGFYIEANALAAVLETSYKARNEFIDNEKIKTDNAIQQAQQRIQVWQIELNILEKFGDADSERAKSLKKYIDEAKQSIEDNKSILAWLDSLSANIYTGSTAGDNTGSVSKELQNEINYFNMLIKAVETLADKEIEALEKEKDALKEKNDEQQRELDLLEAKNNLENAKKQKVFVYKEGQGLVQVQDEKAVKDAQKEYDDIQNEIKEAEIDKQIEQWEEYKNQFSEMENGIKDALTVEQAKKALGTDEQGLLSLDDKTIAGIRDGLAEATYKKDVEDNKDNPKYQTVSLDDFLKSVGAKVNGEQFMKLADNMFSDYRNIVPTNNTNNSTTNNSSISNISTNNNNAVSLNPMFNIYDATDPQKVANSIEKYLHSLLMRTLNSVK